MTVDKLFDVLVDKEMDLAVAAHDLNALRSALVEIRERARKANEFCHDEYWNRRVSRIRNIANHALQIFGDEK